MRCCWLALHGFEPAPLNIIDNIKWVHLRALKGAPGAAPGASTGFATVFPGPLDPFHLVGLSFFHLRAKFKLYTTPGTCTFCTPILVTQIL